MATQVIGPGRVFGEENWSSKWSGERSVYLSGAVWSGKWTGDDVGARDNGLRSDQPSWYRTRVQCVS